MVVCISSHFDKNDYWFIGDQFQFYEAVNIFVEQYGKVVKRTCSGMELADTNPHLHIHYHLQPEKKLPANMAQTFKYKLNKLHGPIPPKSFSIKYCQEKDLKTSLEEHIRYPLKEVPDIERCWGIPSEQLAVMSAKAQEQYRLKKAADLKMKIQKEEEKKSWNEKELYLDTYQADYICGYSGAESRLEATIRALIDYQIAKHDGAGLSTGLKTQALRYLGKKGYLDTDGIYSILFS